ncbi:MAG: hypothetical protein RIS70_2872 [Planctomycetota bacterium]|jgi:HEAT repeat protein
MRVALLIVLVLLVGCGNAKSGAKKKSGKEKAPVTIREFDSTRDALAALTIAYSENQARDVREIEPWFAKNKETALSELGGLATSDDTPLDQRLIACRALARLGTDSIPVLMELTGHKTDQLRYRAAESLGMISPSNERHVDALIELLQGDDSRLKGYAVRALSSAGPIAKRAVPDLVAILNDRTQNEALRNDAKTALVKIDPRRGLMNVKDE